MTGHYTYKECCKNKVSFFPNSLPCNLRTNTLSKLYSIRGSFNDKGVCEMINYNVKRIIGS